MSEQTTEQLRAELERVMKERDEARLSAVPAPGAWICDKCGFMLQKNTMHAQDGSISANVADHCEGCPNDGAAMRPLTWRELNESLFKRATELMTELAALKLKSISNYCVHHNDAERADSYTRCPVCLRSQLDAANRREQSLSATLRDIATTRVPSAHSYPKAVQEIVAAIQDKAAAALQPDAGTFSADCRATQKTALSQTSPGAGSAAISQSANQPDAGETR